MAGTDGVAIARRVGEPILSGHPTRGAEQTGVVWVLHASVQRGEEALLAEYSMATNR